MLKNGSAGYFGRDDTYMAKFYGDECGMTIGSSGSLSTVRQYAKFNYGVGMMPYDADVKGAPQNAMIGGAACGL